MKRCGDAAPSGLIAARSRSAWPGSPTIARSKGASASRRIASRSTSRMTFQTLPSFSDPVVTPMTACYSLLSHVEGGHLAGVTDEQDAVLDGGDVPGAALDPRHARQFLEA